MPPPYADITTPLRPAAIEAALADLAASFPTLCTRTALPNTTHEGRSSSYLTIANAAGPNRPAVLFVGGVHAREWAPPDALVTFARNLLVAYSGGTGITIPTMTVKPLGKPAVTYPAWSIPASDVKSIVETVDLHIFPLANPDGREFDLVGPTSPGWRKNRSPQGTDPQGNAVFGVDLNRNFDIIWDFPNYYDVPLYVSRYGEEPASRVTTDDTFRGPSSASEPETRNVQHLLDTLPIRYYVDVHMFGRNVLFSWGLEEDGSDPAMSFLSADPALKGTRDGLIAGDPVLPGGRTDYKEFLPDDPPTRWRSKAATIAQLIHDEIIRSAHGGKLHPASTVQRAHSEYKVGQSAFLYLPTGGPNSGCSDDYACSRGFVTPSRAPVFAYTLEAGRDEEQGFHCDYGDPPGHFRKINREIHAALLAVLKVAVTTPPPAAPSSGPCLIATATMGDPDHPDVAYLRELRDVRLRATPRGDRAADLLNRVYYSFSPAVARRIERHPAARAAVRRLVLGPLVATLRRLLDGPRTAVDGSTVDGSEVDGSAVDGTADDGTADDAAPAPHDEAR